MPKNVNGQKPFCGVFNMQRLTFCCHFQVNLIDATARCVLKVSVRISVQIKLTVMHMLVIAKAWWALRSVASGLRI
jgi:hypothetical protein